MSFCCGSIGVSVTVSLYLHVDRKIEELVFLAGFICIWPQQTPGLCDTSHNADGGVFSWRFWSFRSRRLTMLRKIAWIKAFPITIYFSRFSDSLRSDQHSAESLLKQPSWKHRHLSWSIGWGNWKVRKIWMKTIPEHCYLFQHLGPAVSILSLADWWWQASDIIDLMFLHLG